MTQTYQRLLRLTGLTALAVMTVTSTLAGETDRPGWSGPNISAALQRARELGQPLLILVRQARCRSCDDVEQLLTEDPEVVPLTRPFLRLRVDMHDAAGKNAARRLKVQIVPTVLFLGPGGMEATRRERDIDRPWLIEQLRVLALRHAKTRTRPSPTTQDLLASLARLEQWGDLDGAERLRARLGSASAAPAVASLEPPTAPSRPVASRRDIDDLLDAEEEPGRLRETAFELSRWLEDRGRTRLALYALAAVLDAIGPDPLTQARAGFLASRHGEALAPMREVLMAARRLTPESVPQLLALARVAETSRRLYQAYHTTEAAAIYAPEDGWIALELYRLQLIIRINSRRSERRDPI